MIKSETGLQHTLDQMHQLSVNMLNTTMANTTGKVYLYTHKRSDDKKKKKKIMSR